MKYMVAILSVVLLSGCMSQRALDNALEAYKTYQSQPHEVELLSIEAAEGKELSFSVTGAKSVRLATAAVPRQILPRNPTEMEVAGDIVKDVAIAAGAIGIVQSLGSPKVVQVPTQVLTQPKPIIVK